MAWQSSSSAVPLTADLDNHYGYTDVESQQCQQVVSHEEAMPTKQHRDALGRTKGLPTPNENWFLNPADAKLVPLVVQHSDSIKSKIPWAIRALNWVWGSRLENVNPEVDSNGDGSVWARWLPGCFAILILASRSDADHFVLLL